MPLYRRLPKKGFSNHPFRVRFEVVNVGDLDKAFEAGAVVDAEALHLALLLPKNAGLWKVLADGTLTKALTVKAHAASAGARDKIAKAGGTLEIVAGKHVEAAKARLERQAKTAAARAVTIAAALAEAEKAKAARAAAPKGEKAPKKVKAAKGEKPTRPAKGEGGGKPEGGRPGGAPKAEGEKAPRPPKGEGGPKGGGGKPDAGAKPEAKG